MGARQHHTVPRTTVPITTTGDRREFKDREDTSLAQHPPSLAALCSQPQYLQQLADTLWVAMLGCQMQGSVTWGEGQIDGSENRQWVCGRRDQLGDRQTDGHTEGSAGLGLNRKGTSPGAPSVSA